MTFGVQWRAFQREAQLAGQQIANGVTALGQASHAKTAMYAQAFFGLSIGLERMGKLIFVADHAISYSGAFPSNKQLREIGHDVSVLIPTCESIAAKLPSSRDYSERPNDAVHHGIIETVSQFGNALRYYNLNFLAGTASGQSDPVGMWWQKVGIPILRQHYRADAIRKDAHDAASLDVHFGQAATVLHTAEEGTAIQNIGQLYMRERATLVVQKYGRLYTLQIVRWLASIINELATKGAYGNRIEGLVGFEEPFDVFMQDDKALRERKTWTIYPK